VEASTLDEFIVSGKVKSPAPQKPGFDVKVGDRTNEGIPGGLRTNRKLRFHADSDDVVPKSSSGKFAARNR
jgi:hypothetical protein